MLERLVASERSCHTKSPPVKNVTKVLILSTIHMKEQLKRFIKPNSSIPPGQRPWTLQLTTLTWPFWYDLECRAHGQALSLSLSGQLLPLLPPAHQRMKYISDVALRDMDHYQPSCICRVNKHMNELFVFPSKVRKLDCYHKPIPSYIQNLVKLAEINIMHSSSDLHDLLF